MSGGVDSSIAAALLKKQGYDVIGITMQVWPNKKSFGGCCSLEAVGDAKRVASKLNIPHYTLNFREIFKEKVVDNFVEEYKNGRTPNPCIRCNQFVKFEHLLWKASELGADLIATGHYVRVEKSEVSAPVNLPAKRKKSSEIIIPRFKLLKGIDAKKDQSYVLYMLNQKSLTNILFPLGNLTKEEVRGIARDLELPVAEKEESQEICFIEDDDYGRFLKEVYPQAIKPGQILDKKGNTVGTHNGIAFFTLGQRKGIGSHCSKPKYVVQIDREKNVIVIGDQKETLGNELIADGISYVSGLVPQEPLNVTAKIRYNSPDAEAVLYPFEDNKAKIIFKKSQRAITPGQSVVFYKGDEVIGGGIIS
jgi:tRNA-specific 2-thiouridylase